MFARALRTVREAFVSVCLWLDESDQALSKAMDDIEAHSGTGFADRMGVAIMRQHHRPR